MNPMQHALLIGRGWRQGIGFCQYTDPAGRAPTLAAANRGMRHAKHFTCVKDGKSVWNIDPSPARISDAGDAAAALPMAPERAGNENAGRHAEQRCENAPGNVIEKGPHSGQGSRCERAREKARILIKRGAQLALTGDEPEKRKNGQQDSGRVDVWQSGFVPSTQTQP